MIDYCVVFSVSYCTQLVNSYSSECINYKMILNGLNNISTTKTIVDINKIINITTVVFSNIFFMYFKLYKDTHLTNAAQNSATKILTANTMFIFLMVLI